MLEQEQASGKCRQWGSSTQKVIEAIQAGKNTLPEISDHTGISYRSCNSIVYSLEMQDRVHATDYSVKRGFQRFRVLLAHKQPVRSRGFVEHPRKRKSLAADVQNMLGVGALPAHLAFSTTGRQIQRIA